MATIVTTNFQLPQSIISNGAVTGNEWTDPNNLLLVDGDVSESNPGTGVASDVIIGNFNANVPSNAVILGIEIEIFAYRGAQISPAISLTPYAVDNTTGTDLYYPYITPLNSLTQTLASYVLGTPTYLFNTTWTPDQINNFKLQLIANGNVYADSALLKVYYEIPDPVVPAPSPEGFAADGNSPIQAQPFYLALDFAPGDRYAYLKSFNYVNGIPIFYTDLGSAGGVLNLTFDPGLAQLTPNSNFEENCATVSWTTMANGTVQIDFGADLSGRGLMNKTPFESDPSLISGHDANSKVIISNNAPFMNQYLRKSQLGYVFSGPIEVDNEGVPLETTINKINFVGPAVNATTDGTGDITVTIGQSDAQAPISAARTFLSANFSTTSGLNSVPFDGESYDLNNEMVSGLFTAKNAGYYQINSVLTWSGVISNSNYAIFILKNGNQYSYSYASYAGSSGLISSNISDVVQLAIGDTIQIFYGNLGGGGEVLVGDGEATFLSITLVETSTPQGAVTPTVVNLATAAILPNTPTYNNGASGVSATLTSTVNAVLSVDGVNPSAGTFLLVKNQASSFQNGIYVVSLVGSGAGPWKLTRVSNYDSPAEINYSTAVSVISGTANALTGWLMTSQVTTVGTSAISYSPYIYANIVTANSVQTLTNKRITKRFVAVTQSATPEINTDNMDIASITGLAQAITSMTSSLTGTPSAGDLLMIQFTDNGTARAISWGAKFGNTTITLPASTPGGSVLLRVVLEWDTVAALWQCVGVA